MNTEQVKSLVRWLVAAFGASLAGYIAGKGWAPKADVLDFLGSDKLIQIVGAAATLVSLLWSLRSKTERNVVVAANAMPNVAGVITNDTPAGKQLAKDVPDPAVASAGSASAKAIAKA